MFGGRVSSWNLRDRHMADTLDALLAHLDRERDAPAKIVVWAHNSHLGDARATEIGARGRAQRRPARPRAPRRRRAVSIGFTTYTGTVTAADDWGGPAERKRVRPGLPGSYEELFHDDRRCRVPALPLRRRSPAADALRRAAAGARHRRHLPARDRTAEPLLRRPARRPVRRRDPPRPHARRRPAGADLRWEAGEVPETFPTGV